MKLAKYVRDVQRSDDFADGFPGVLELPPDLVLAFDKLYDAGEREAREYGAPLSLDEGYKTFILGGLAKGKPYMPDMDIPKLIDERFFGDVHSHPTASIGEAGGYSAHSMEDCLSFREHLDKRLFIGFVISGPWIYAMAYRKGLSRFDEDAIGQLKYKQAQEMQNSYVGDAWAGDFEGFVAWQLETQSALYERFKRERLDSEELTERIAIEERKALAEHKRAKATDLGALCQHLSLRDCAAVAEKLAFGFYAGMRGQGAVKDGRELALVNPGRVPDRRFAYTSASVLK